jgi:TIR domain
MPNKVFISYRREDSRYQARRIYDAFVHALPPDTVFMDVDSIAPGDDFVEILEGWVQQCEVLLALIGPRWLNSIDPRTNLRRLDNPEDFVHIEIRGALARKIPVVPVLLDAAEMPTAAELPDDIKALRRKNAEFVDFRTFDADVQRLIKRLKLGKKNEQPADAPAPQAADSGTRHTVVATASTFFQRIKPQVVAPKPPLLAAAAGALLVIAGIAYAISTGPRVDASAGLADFAKSEQGRQAAEVRAGQATDALAIAVKARQEAEAVATDAAAAQAKSEEGRRAAEARAGEASDAQAKAEKTRQEAEAKATAAVAALTKTDENRRAAEARANEAADALKKSDKARLDAEARATSAAAALAKAEDGLKTAEKARLAVETAANAAASAKAQADNGRQYAEVRANDTAEALRKSEAARQEAEARATSAAAAQAKAEDALRSTETARWNAVARANDAEEALKKSEVARREAEAKLAAPVNKAPQSPQGPLLASIGSSSRWVRDGWANCGNRDRNRSMTSTIDSITWIDGSNVDVEAVTSTTYDEFQTRTQKSAHVPSDTNISIGTTWTYSRVGDGMRAQNSLGQSYILVRCP